MTSDSETYAYLAGYFDGEGCVTVHQARNGIYTLVVQVASGDLETIQLFSSVFGGNLSAQRKKANSKRQLFRWARHTKDAQFVLSALLPYLRAKRPAAELALSLSFSPRGSNRKIGENRLSDAERLLRKEVASQLSQFNHRVTYVEN